MNKADLIRHLAEQAMITNKQAEAVLNALVTTVHEVVRAGEELSIPDLGKFSSVERAAKIGRNPKTGASIQIDAKRAPKFNAAKALKDAAAG